MLLTYSHVTKPELQHFKDCAINSSQVLILHTLLFDEYFPMTAMTLNIFGYHEQFRFCLIIHLTVSSQCLA